MKFIFLRHGKTEYNEQGLTQGWCDSPLSKTGLKQASYTKEALKDVVIDYAYCSPSGRARQTASIVLGNRDISVMIDDRLKEINFGIFCYSHKILTLDGYTKLSLDSYSTCRCIQL